LVRPFASTPTGTTDRTLTLRCHRVTTGNFSDITRFHCAGCNDGYFAQYLTRNLGWSHARLPVDGLRSLLFHGPSPTHCIAAGNVWFDHPEVNRVGCLSHEGVQKLLHRDVRQKKDQHLFDWERYNHSSKICLRLSKRGHGMHGEFLTLPGALHLGKRLQFTACVMFTLQYAVQEAYIGASLAAP
jgi:hypothetical protein